MPPTPVSVYLYENCVICTQFVWKGGAIRSGVGPRGNDTVQVGGAAPGDVNPTKGDCRTSQPAGHYMQLFRAQPDAQHAACRSQPFKAT